MRAVYSIIVSLLLFCLALDGLTQEGFVENKGQWPAQVNHKLQVSGGSLFLEDHALTYWLFDPVVFQFLHPSDNTETPPELLNSHVYKTHFIGSQQPVVSQENPTGAYYNYYLGNDPSLWANHAEAFDRVLYADLYDGIDVRYTITNQAIKYDILVRPGGNPADVVLQFEGLEKIAVKNGQLVLHTSVGNVMELPPYAYQFIEGRLKEVECHYHLEGQAVTFDLGDFDPLHTLVIDPEVTFASYIGASASNFGFTATDDLNGNLIAGADVFNTGYPTTVGAVSSDFNSSLGSYCDAAITKFAADGGALLYSTYLGGSGLEMPHSVIADSDDNWIVMGTTGSLDFPTTVGAYQTALVGGAAFNFGTFFIPAQHANGCDFFVSKFNADGTGLLASTYVGQYGTDGLNTASKLFYNYGDSFRGEVIVDANDNIIVASTTHSTSFPTTSNAPQPNHGGGLTDAILFRMDPMLNDIDFATYFGGSSDDSGYSVQVDGAGNLVMCGGTKSANIDMWSNADDDSFGGDVDGYIVKYSPDGGSILASTYCGTAGYDQCYFVQIDASDYIYVIGQTDAPMPIEGTVYNIANSGQFIRKYEPDLSERLWSTTVGTGSGEIDISPTAFLVSDCDQIYFSGWGGATNANNSNFAWASTTNGLPITGDAYQSSTDGSDFYLCVLAPNATSLVYGTFFGGGQSNEHVDGGTSKFDKNGSVYQAVCAGCGGNDDFPTTPGAWSADNGSSNCNLGVFKFDLGSIHAIIDIEGPPEVCEGQPAMFVNNSTGGTSYFWSFGDGETSTEFQPNYSYEDYGDFYVTLTVTDTTGCLSPDSTDLWVTILQGVNPIIDPVDPICEGGTAQLWGYGTANMYWLPDPSLSATDIPNPTATPDTPTTYYLVDSNDCEADTVSVTVNFVNVNTDAGGETTICIGDDTELWAEGGQWYFWEPAIFVSNPSVSNPVVDPDETTMFYVTITTPEECEVLDSVLVNVDLNPPGGQTYPDWSLCTGESITLGAANGFTWLWSPAGSLNDPTIQFPVANPSDTTTYTVAITNACGSGTDQVTVNVIIPDAFAGDDGQVCLGQWFPVWAAGGETYWWTPPQYAANPDQSTTSVSPPESMDMVCYVTDQYGCTASSAVHVHVLPLPDVDAGPDRSIDWMDDAHLFGYATGNDFWWEPDLWIECTDCLTPLVQPEESLWYYLHTIDDNGCVGIDSAYVDIYFPLYIPNTITPDNDGRNDVFRAYGDNIRGFHMEIYSRWGELIFSSDDITKVWDGSVREGDHYVQIDTYVWMVWYDALEGRKKLMGHVNVVR